MKGLLARTAAKVNFSLRVLGRRPDGYHEVESVLHTIGLWDRLRLTALPEAGRITLSVDSGEAPADESNLCWRAAQLLARRARVKAGVGIRLEKAIPPGAGLGGGSSDAAATLVGLARLWELGFGRGELEELGAELGADVPFFLRGGCCLARGKGEKLQDLPAMLAWLVVVVPEERVPTAQAYAALAREAGRRPRAGPSRTAQAVIAALGKANLEALAKALQSDFEAVPLAGIAEALLAKEELIRAGCLGASLSGSGSAAFGIAGSRQAAEDIGARLRARWSRVEVAATLPAGASLLVCELEETWYG